MTKRVRHLIDLLLYLLLINGVFFVLYRHFIIGNGVYLYNDIGSDSYASSYPIITMLSNLFRQHRFSQYELSAGLGNNIAATYLQYLNPLKTFLLLFPKESMPTGLLLYLFLQTNVTAVAGLYFFRLLLQHETAAFIPATIWSFSGYTVLWTQNLSFGVCIAMFTLTMLALAYCLQKPSVRAYLALTGILAVFLVTNYYFYYMTGIFTVLYTIFAGLFQRRSLREIFHALLRLALSAFASFLLCAADIAAILSVFIGSPRTSEITQTVSLTGHRNLPEVLTLLGRMISTNFFGRANDYFAAANFYEAAALSSSALLFIAISYLLLTRKYRLRTLLLLIVTVLLTLSSFVSYAMTFNLGSCRHLFLTVFVGVIAIGFFVREVFISPEKRSLILSVIFGLGSAALLITAVKYKGAAFGFSLNYRAVLFFAAFLLVYALLLLLRIRIQRLVLPLLILLVAAEMLIVNYDTINYRSYYTKDLYAHSFVNGSTSMAAQEIKEMDDGLYRIAGSTYVGNANMGMINDFYGMTAYSNTVPNSLMQLSIAQNMYQESKNLFLVNYTEYLQYTLLGGRYMIRNGYAPISQGMEPSLMEQIDRIYLPERGIDKVLLKNRFALPFGYLYHSQVTKQDYEESDANERAHLLTSSYFETNGEDDLSLPKAKQPHQDEAVPLLDFSHELNDVTVSYENGMTILDTADETAVIHLSFDQIAPDQDTVQYVHLKFEPTSPEESLHFIVYPLTVQEPLAKETYARQVYLTKDYPEVNLLLPDQTQGLRIDVRSPQSKLTTMELITCKGLSENLTKLQSSPIRNIRFEDDCYEADVTADENAMLAVPFIYAKEWTAEVNGKPAAVHNINGGILGIALPKGNAHVVIRYKIAHFSVGLVISGLALLLYLLGWGLSGKIEHTK